MEDYNEKSAEDGSLYGCKREAAEDTMAFIRLAIGAFIFAVPVAIAAIAESFTGYNLAAPGIAIGVAFAVVYSVAISRK